MVAFRAPLAAYGPGENRVAPFSSKGGPNTGLSNLYQCTIPVGPVLAGWVTNGVFSPHRIELMRGVGIPAGATWSSAEAAYQFKVFAVAVFGRSTTAPLTDLVHFLAGGKYNDPANLRGVTGAGGKPIMKEKQICGLIKKLEAGNLCTAGKTVKIFMRKYGINFRPPVTLPAQTPTWAPIHDAKFGDSNPVLRDALKKLVVGEPVVFVELNSTGMHQKPGSWGPWGGGVRDTRFIKAGTTFGANVMGQLIARCAQRLHGAEPVAWIAPTAMFKTRTEIAAWKAANGAVVKKPVKRKAKAKAAAPGTFSQPASSAPTKKVKEVKKVAVEVVVVD